jgi:hypothetical protein
MRTLPFLFAAGAIVVLFASDAGAYPGLTDAFLMEYPSATNLLTCGTCHTGFASSDGPVNPYGAAIAAEMNAGSGHLEAFHAVEQDDSDGDGTSNIDEILTDAGFFPGWTCETYTSALSAPLDLADFVDPVDPGCSGATTTTVTTQTTTTTVTTQTSTTTSSTSTTLSDVKCAQPVSSGPIPVSTDCLYILQASVGLQTCAPACVCSPSGDDTIAATDALMCLNASIGIEVLLDCPC